MKKNIKNRCTIFFSLLLISGLLSFRGEENPSIGVSYDKITFKASHNSYERNESIRDQLTFRRSQPYNSGCMGLEFDIHRNSYPYTPGRSISENYFTVAHNRPATTPLADYLDQVKKWHYSQPHHPPVLITLDIKSTGGGYSGFHNEIDTYLKVHFGENLIFKPGKLFKNGSYTLCQNVITYGWPRIDDWSMKGKFIFCLSGNKSWKATYAATNLRQRLCFSDKDLKADDIKVRPPTRGNFVFFNFHIYSHTRQTWMSTIPRFADKKLITRAYIANSSSNWRDCIAAKVSAIATDKIRNHSWAKVSNTMPYVTKKTTNSNPGTSPNKPSEPTFDMCSIKNKGNNEYRTNAATKMQSKYQYPKCTFIFEKQAGANIYAIRNAMNKEYLDCSITSMSRKVNDNCQRWQLIPAGRPNEYYIRNLKNKEYLTRRASKLSKTRGHNEVHYLQKR